MIPSAPLSFSALPTLSSSQAKELDRLCQERFGIPTDWLMEAAGWQVARYCRRPTAVVCGVGNNAGDGLAAARHLHRWGLLTSVACVDPTRLRGIAADELNALRGLGIEVAETLELDGAELVVDAIFGTGLSRAPDGRFAEWITLINGSGKSVVALDVPSGLDAETGISYSPTVRADVTVTLGLPKRGLRGEVVVLDIGIPSEAYATLGIDVPGDLQDLIRR